VTSSCLAILVDAQTDPDEVIRNWFLPLEATRYGIKEVFQTNRAIWKGMGRIKIIAFVLHIETFTMVS